MYQNGLGVEQNYHKAVQYYLKSANQGNSDAQNNIGIASFHLVSKVVTRFIG